MSTLLNAVFQPSHKLADRTGHPVLIAATSYHRLPPSVRPIGEILRVYI